MWSAIEDRLEPARPRYRFVFLLAPIAAAALLVWLARPHRSVEPTLDTPTIAADSDARIELLESDAQQVTLQLHEGHASFHTGRDRRLVVEAGRARVEAAPSRIDVIETSFQVYRSEETLRIVVERGELLVRSPDIADGVRRLAAGESLVLEAAPAVEAPADRGDRASTGTRPGSNDGTNEPSNDGPSGSADGSNGGSNRTRGVHGERGQRVEKVSVEELLGDADRLRRAGKLDEAVRVLALVAEAPDDPLAGMAWLTRARVLLELGRESEAAKDLARAIDAGLPPALEQRARTRLEELAP
jgi:hypothetical protein